MKSLQPKFLTRLRFDHHQIKKVRDLSQMQLQNELQQKRVLPKQQALRCLGEAAQSSVGLISGAKTQRRRKTDQTPRLDFDQLRESYQQTRTYIEAQELSVCVRNIQQVHYLLFRQLYSHAGEWRDENTPQREPAPDKRFSADAWVFFQPSALPGNIYASVALYKRVIDKLKVDPCIAAPLFVLDFLCISPFVEGNGLVARLLLHWLWLNSGHNVLRAESIEKHIAASVGQYEAALSKSVDGWQQGEHEPVPWLEYCWDLLAKCYQHQGVDSEWSSRQLVTTRYGDKSQQVAEYVAQQEGLFTLSDVKLALPHISIDTIKLAVRELRQQGKVRCLGRGRGAAWRRVTQEVA